MELTPRPHRILVVCTHNSVRSPMAEALLRRALPGVEVLSAGLDPRTIDPFVVALMAEEGLDLSNHEERVFDPAEEPDFDLLITLSKTAWIAARTLAARTKVPAEYWQVSDPPPPLFGEEPREQILEGYRAIRDDLVRHISNRFDIDFATGLSLAPAGVAEAC